MYRLLTLLFKLAIYIGAPLTIIAATITGGQLPNITGIAMPIWLGYLLGGVLGIVIATAIFGLPLMVLAIHDDLLKVHEALHRLQLSAGAPPPVPGLMETVIAPVLAERAFERLLGD